VALSAPFALLLEDDAPAGSGPRLSDRFADLRSASAARPSPNAASQVNPRADAASPVTPEFVDDAEAAGLQFVFDNGRTAQRRLPETMSGGVGLLDFDGDGWLDVYCVQGGALDAGWDGSGRPEPAPGDRLFRNRGNGCFEDVTKASGIAAIAWGRGYGLGVAVGDYDNDGDPDLFVSRLQTYA
jgi:hypothetical protein